MPILYLMKVMWFVYTNEVVSGPFETDAVRAKIHAQEIAAGSFIWWKGQREWVPVAAWESQLDQVARTSVDRAEKAVWYIDQGGQPVGPLTENEMISQLRSMESVSRIRLWAVGMEKWTSIFELGDVMEQLGISRRENERAPIMGTVAVTRSNEDPKGFMLRAASISVGGIGLVGEHDLRHGDSISLLVKSGDIPGNMHLRGQVAYVTKAGYVGVRFDQVHPETQSLIFDYVKRFHVTEATITRAA
jgi:hypothetical protein